jgi:hypothetical protein
LESNAEKTALTAFDRLFEDRPAYERILRKRLLETATNAFRRRFALSEDYSDEKIIDMLIWKFIPFLRQGAVRDGSVVYI